MDRALSAATGSTDPGDTTRPRPRPPLPSPRPAPSPPSPPLRPRHRDRALAWAAGPLLAVPAVVAGCRALDADGDTPLPQLLSFLPWLTVPAALGLLLAAAARRRVLAFLAVLVLTATAWASLPYTPLLAVTHGHPLARVRVIAANVEFGQATGSLIDLARRERPQLLYVSECDPACGRALTAALSGQLPHRVSVDAAGSAGSVLLSAYPLRDRSVVPATMGMPGATAEIAGRPVRLQLAHPMPPVPGQVALWKAELARLRDAVADRPADEALIVAGDFNASQDHAAYRDLVAARLLLDAARVTGASRTPTWPAEGPLPPYVQIDHVLTSTALTPTATRFPALPGSDHRAVVADLDLHDGR
ncbi:endonuclease/exonuclease/phosphatase family protein [Streptomyces roseofulvus]|uniref:Endonuclease/exonuclease/phosphatase family protein n=2 Tax=Streptomyces TaxID=1883 RepID=A0ABU4K503_9ACTN|nr:endonuclease/exonuclease/phosphatase family protein [Streptomyces roseolus]MDX2292812.1 endonuclease/exonuclease/phosphatase family protein [Streptomyces roseolus]